MSWGQAFYFSVTTITTLGYGEITPANGIAQLLTSLQALSGVLALGLLLIGLAQAIAAEQSLRFRQSAKGNLMFQYEIWREDVIDILLSMMDDQRKARSISATDLSDPKAFSEFFGGGPNTPWSQCMTRMDLGSRYVIEILRASMIFETEIRQFSLCIAASDQEGLRSMSAFLAYLARLQTQVDDRDVDDLSKSLWQILAAFDPMIGYREGSEFPQIVARY